MKNNLLSEQLVYTGDSRTPTHFHLCTYSPTEIEQFSSDDFQEIREKLHTDRINWLQIHGLEDTGSIQKICNHFEINFLILQDILNAHHPAKIEELDNYLVLILKLFTLNNKKSDQLERMTEEQVCLIVGNNFVLTFMENENTFYADIETALLHDVLKIRNRQSDYLLSVLLNSIMANYTSVITSIDSRLDSLEEELFNNRGTDTDFGNSIQTLRHQYLMIKRGTLPLKEQYAKILRGESMMIHKANRAFFNDVNDHLQFVLQSIDTCRETLASLVDLYISNNDLRMNSIMKRLTIVSTIFIPLTFLAGVWGMNFKAMPELEWEYGYLFAWSVMLAIGIIVYLYFRKKKWN